MDARGEREQARLVQARIDARREPYQIESQIENAAFARRSKNVGQWLWSTVTWASTR
jgi:hypothetical protein